jgi:hypothetical protein
LTVGQHIARRRLQATVEGRLMKDAETGGPGLTWNCSSSLVNVTHDFHGKKLMVYVHLHMTQQNNGQTLSKRQHPKPRYTGERLLRERPKIYRQIVRLLGEGWSANKICKLCHVTRESVRAVERREATE